MPALISVAVPPYFLRAKVAGTKNKWKAFLASLCLTAAGATSSLFSAAPAPAAPAAPATAGVNLSQLYTDGMSAFQTGNYQKAATTLETVIAQATPDSPLEPVYYTLGAAYFNLQDYPKAVETLKTYLSKYPKGARIVDALSSVGQASLLNKDYQTAAESFKELEKYPQMRDLALYNEGSALKEAGQVDDAITVLAKLVGNEIQNTQAANGAILLAGLYAQKKDTEHAIALLHKVENKVRLIDNVVRLNSLAIEMGDEMLQANEPAAALACYNIVRTPAEVVEYQNARIRDMESALAQNKAAMHAQPTLTLQLTGENNRLATAIAASRKLLEEFQKLPDFEPALLLRMGRAYYESGEKWESIVAYDELIRRFPESQEYETALFGIAVSSAETNRGKKAREYCEEYLKKFPAGANIAAVGYLLGATAMQSNDMEGAENYFGRLLANQPAGTYREEMQFQLGNVRFSLGKYEDAAKDYTAYSTAYPNGTHIEEAEYRIALAMLFAGKYEDAMKLIQGYLAKYPKGNFIADAKYRLAVCLYSAEQYDEVIADCRAWEKEFGKDTMIGEVLALLADAFASTDKEGDAVDIYIRASKIASTPQVINYSLTAAEKILQKKGEWEKIDQMYEDFVKDHPQDPAAVSAVYYISKAKVHEGKADEAKQFIADAIKKYIDDPKASDVEKLITQLAQLCMHKTPVASAETVASPGENPSPSPTPAVALDPGAELEALLGKADTDQSPTARARVLFAKSELARLRRQIPEQEKDLQVIADNFKAEDLSAMLLATVGDYLLSKDKTDKAEVFFHELMDGYPKSDLLDFGYNGLGEIAFRRKQYDDALKFFSDAIDKGAATQKLREVTVGRAKTLLALGKFDEAKKIFEEVASIREWRGEATAFSVYSLGEIAQQQNKLPEAIAHYQRVYVAYQKFLPWVAKAYVKSAECFAKLGKTTEEMNTYREMLKNDKLSAFPESVIARKQLEGATQ